MTQDVMAQSENKKPDRGGKAPPELKRHVFSTSRLMDFMSVKDLTAQIGHPRSAWPLVLVKELIDNAVDACEEAAVAPKITISVNAQGLTVSDNGPGIPAEVVGGAIDFSVRVSSREAYVSPCRGAQGNALKTIIAMPFVLNGECGKVTIVARGIRHEITVRVDHIRQQPVVEHIKHSDEVVQTGTSVTIHAASSKAEPDTLCGQDRDREIVQNEVPEGRNSASSLMGSSARIVQIADDFAFANPHVSLNVNWFGEQLLDVLATNPCWKKWRPSDPTSPHWYKPEHFARLVSAYLSHGEGGQRTVRELVSEFRGLATSAKQKAVLDATGLHRVPLQALVHSDGTRLTDELVVKLLDAMKRESKPVKPALLGLVGRDHLAAKFEQLGCEMESFQYERSVGEKNGLPWVVETAFAWCPNAKQRRIITGINWSPCITNPFRELGSWGTSLDTLLAQQRANAAEPVVLFLHLVCPRVVFADRGKSTIVIEG
jgi:DNA topoisomerase VI subunit B